MKIMMLNYLDSSAPGGISKVVSELEGGLRNLGHDVRVIQPNEPEFPDNNNFHAFRRHGLLNRMGFHHLRFGDIKSISDEIRTFTPTIVNIHGSRTFLSPWAVIRIKRMFPEIPIIFSPHHDSKSGSTISGKYLFWAHKSTLLRTAYRNADAISVCSEFELEQVYNCFSGDRKKISLVPNGIDILTPSKKLISNREKIIISAGFLFELKGVSHTIRALRELHDRGDNEWRLIICGEGPYKKKLQKLADKIGISEHVEWKGFVSRDSLISLINTSRVATLVSRSENFGIFAAECLSLGVPTIVTNVTALPEFDWIDWCHKIPYPVDHKILADSIIKASTNETQSIIDQGNIQSWKSISLMMEKLLMKVSEK